MTLKNNLDTNEEEDENYMRKEVSITNNYEEIARWSQYNGVLTGGGTAGGPNSNFLHNNSTSLKRNDSSYEQQI